MEAATVPRRAAAAAPATAPRRTPAKRPRSRPAPGKRTSTRRRTAATAAPAKRAAPVRAPSKRAAPAKRAPARRTAPSRRSAPAHLIPIAVGTAARVRSLPDSFLILRLTRGRAWIGVLGVLLAGIVALNVFTLSLAAEAGQIDQNILALEKENGILGGRDTQRSGSARVRHDAAALGLGMADVDQVTSVEAGGDDLAVAVQRLAAAGGGY
jgi:hypothetical protein